MKEFSRSQAVTFISKLKSGSVLRTVLDKDVETTVHTNIK